MLDIMQVDSDKYKNIKHILRDSLAKGVKNIKKESILD